MTGGKDDLIMVRYFSDGQVVACGCPHSQLVGLSNTSQGSGGDMDSQAEPSGLSLRDPLAASWMLLLEPLECRRWPRGSSVLPSQEHCVPLPAARASSAAGPGWGQAVPDEEVRPRQKEAGCGHPASSW